MIIKAYVSLLGLLKFCLKLNLNIKPSSSCNCKKFGFGLQTVEHCMFLLLTQDASKCLAVTPITDFSLKTLLKIEMWQSLNLYREIQASLYICLQTILKMYFKWRFCAFMMHKMHLCKWTF